ncbi:MAG TPA: AsnC family protein [Rhodopila sp.]|uniref:AsnC family protein n=1 Tax=Rhodopila sp. TaxID=2480087 RepID=UPI002C682AC4|nr:AsnC family protein [Rhodopila sp.]HVY13658.1 AsnC family protein [Rhodopila sp.]
MPSKFVWSEGQDSRLRRLRAEGVEWDVVARTLGMTRWAVIERGRRLGITRRPVADMPAEPVISDRPPLPAGHPESWDLINRGTILEAVPFRAPGQIR